jgi:hypothetical protein
MEEKEILIFKTIRKIKINPDIIYNLESYDINYNKKWKEFDEEGIPFFIRLDRDEFIVICHYGLTSGFNEYYKKLKYVIDLIENNNSYANIEIFCCYPGIAKRREKEFSKYIKNKTKKVCAFKMVEHKKERILELSKTITIINRKERTKW